MSPVEAVGSRVVEADDETRNIKKNSFLKTLTVNKWQHKKYCSTLAPDKVLRLARNKKFLSEARTLPLELFAVSFEKIYYIGRPSPSI